MGVRLFLFRNTIKVGRGKMHVNGLLSQGV